MKERLAIALLIVICLMSACADDGGETAPPPDPPEVWNPCSGLSVVEVGDYLGIEVSMESGTPSEPRCTLRPAGPGSEGAPVVDANYVVFPAGLDEAWDSMGLGEGEVSSPAVPGADDARLVVNVEGDTFLVTGFVQNGDLIHIVNAVDPAPFARGRVVDAVESVLADLSAYAETSETA